MKKFELFDHTADLGLRIYGASLAELFENAGSALFSVLTDTALVQQRQTHNFELVRDTTEELLVEWLGALLYLFDTQHFLCSSFSVLNISDCSLVAAACGEPYEPGRHVIKAELKAITYHGLSVRRESDIWLATVIIDI